MTCDDADSQVSCNQHHEVIFCVEFIGKIFGMTREIEALLLHVIFVDGRSDQCVGLADVEVNCRCFQWFQGTFARNFGGGSEFNRHILFPGIDDIYFFVDDWINVFDGSVIEIH